MVDLLALYEYLKTAPSPPPEEWVKPVVEAFVYSVVAGLILKVMF